MTCFDQAIARGARADLAMARASVALELRHAGSLRRDMASGLLPRQPAISAVRDCLRHAAMMNATARRVAQALPNRT